MCTSTVRVVHGYLIYKLIMPTSKSVPGGTSTSWPASPFCAAVARMVRKCVVEFVEGGKRG